MERKEFEAIIISLNNRPVDDFEGFSPADMRYLLYDPYSPDSPLRIRDEIPDMILDKIPFFGQIEYLLNLILEAGEFKLTAKGYMPTPVVKEIYNLGLIRDEFIEDGITKLYAETSCNAVHLTRIITELSGFTRKKHNKLSLTANWKGKLVNGDRQSIFTQAFITFARKFNWAYFDGYESQNTGQLGLAFTLFLLHKYGNKERPDSFYSDKYLRAFPLLLGEFPTETLYRTPRQALSSCYSIRTFERFLEYFSLVELRYEGKKYYDEEKYVKKSEIFDLIFSFDI